MPVCWKADDGEQNGQDWRPPNRRQLLVEVSMDCVVTKSEPKSVDVPCRFALTSLTQLQLAGLIAALCRVKAAAGQV